MFFHIIPQSRLRSAPGVLTYRCATKLAPGQLVLITLRGRKIPGIVLKSKDNPGTSAYILPVKKIGGIVLPEAYLALINTAADYYVLNLARTWHALSPYINTTYVTDGVSLKTGPQKLVLTPSDKTPVYQSLRGSYITLPTAAPAKRELWLGVASGKPVTIMGGLAAASLPFAKLTDLVIDSPFASPYTSERAPSFNAVQIALMQANIQGARVTVRTAVPEEILRANFAQVGDPKIICPKINPIELVRSNTNYRLNSGILSDIKDKATRYKKVLIYVNVLEGLDQMALEIAKKTGIHATTLRQDSDQATAPITIATSTILYSPQISFGYAYVLSAEGLVSPLRAKSAPEAIETLGVLAARSPLTVQYVDNEHWLVELCRRQLVSTPEIIRAIPQMAQRIIQFTHKKPEQDVAIATNIKQLWPQTLTGISDGLPAIACLSQERLTAPQVKFIAALPSSWSVKTRSHTLPKTA